MLKHRMKKTGTLLVVLFLALASLMMAASAEEMEIVQVPEIVEGSAIQPVAESSEPAAGAGQTHVEPTAPPNEPAAPVMRTVQFINADGELFYALQVEDGRPVAAPVFLPQIEGYTFLYWKDIDLVETEDVEPAYDFVNMPVERDMILVAVYDALPQPVVEGDVMVEATEPQEPEEDPEELPETLEDGTKVIGKREETLGGLPILIIEDDDEELLDDEAELNEEELDEEETDEEIVLEDDEIPLAGPAAGSVPDTTGFGVQVYSSLGDCIDEGEAVDMWGELVGYDGSFGVRLQWQYFTDGAWVDAEGATSLRHSFVATPETVNYQWRLAATVYTLNAEQD